MKSLKEYINENSNAIIRANIEVGLGEEFLDLNGKPIKGSMKVGPDTYVVPSRPNGWYTLVQYNKAGKEVSIEISSSALEWMGMKLR